MNFIDKENRLLRPKNLFEPAPGKGFEIYKTNKEISIGVLNLMGNVFMKKCDDVFEVSKKFIDKYQLKKDYDFLIVDFHFLAGFQGFHCFEVLKEAIRLVVDLDG